MASTKNGRIHDAWMVTIVEHASFSGKVLPQYFDLNYVKEKLKKSVQLREQKNRMLQISL